MTRQQFNREWHPDTIPACDEGLALLRRFAEARPHEHAFVRPSDFKELDNPAFAAIPEWDTFARHRASCHKCTQV